MGNRKQPFGYRMEQGTIVIFPAEAEVVSCIFETYIAGATFQSLVHHLNSQSVPYIAEKPWNKNMVARILGDFRYVGKDGYPSIIAADVMETAQQIRLCRQAPVQKTPAQKLIRQLSGHTATPEIETEAPFEASWWIRTTAFSILFNFKPPSER